MISLLLAIQFLTIIPLKIKRFSERKASLSLICFPLVGLLLGALLCASGELLSVFGFRQLSIDVILIVLLIVLTGGMHLDGLSDTFDALLSNKDKPEMLSIMRDSRAGVMGMLSVVSIILLKIVLLFSLPMVYQKGGLLLMCILSRWAMVLSMFYFPYARLEGKARIFINGINWQIFLAASAVALASVLVVWGFKALIIFILVALFTLLFGKFISRKLGGITGDTLGATNELAEVLVLLSAVFLV